MKKVLLVVLALMVCLVLTACGKVQEIEENQEETGNTQASQTIEETKSGTTDSEETLDISEGLEKAQDTIDNMDLYSDDTKYVITLEENTTGIYYHDGEKITGYEVRVKYNSHEEAELAKVEYEKENEEDDDIEFVVVKGNELVATFKPEAYEDTNLSEVKAAFELIKAMQGSNKE